MEPTDYNQKKYAEGRFTWGEITGLVRSFQDKCGLTPDGMFGPKSKAALHTQMSPLSAMSITDPASSRLGLAALQVAKDNIGQGEEGGNNSGPFVEMVLGKVYDGDPDDDGSWCAGFVSWCFEEAARGLGVSLPFNRSLGAKKLFRNIRLAGTLVDTPAPGDVVCWDRGQPGSWQGHIGFVSRVSGGILYTVEGNVGTFPSKVREFQHDLSRQGRLEGFARPPAV